MPTKPSTKQVRAAATNFSSGRKNSKITRIVIHTQQGTETGTENWFTNPQAHASAHYGISFAGDVTQFVDDADTAWHAGNAVYNRCSIGIELEGFMERAYFPDAMLTSLAQLVSYLCDTYDVPRDRAHIIGHAEVPDPKNPGEFGGTAHHKDPGPGFDWDAFMARLDQDDSQLVS